MIIKKFTGKTEKEAVEAAKKELGNGVVVMNVKDVKKGGFLGFFRSRIAEVTVALEEENERFSPIRKDRAAETAAKEIKPAMPSLGESSKSIEQKLDSLQNLLVSQIQKADSEKKDEAESRGENKPESKEEAFVAEEESENVKFLKLIYNTMIENEVDEKNANQLIDEVDKLIKPNMPLDHILASAYQRMILKFGKTAMITPAEKGPKVIMFIGPTGVGKTTTIAKIASFYALEEKKKVALLTADTYRIAAAEQLHTYANILEVPFRVIYTEEEMKEAVESFSDYDYIFVDTSGHSHKNEEQIEKTKKLLGGVDGLAEKQIFLVLSATTKYKDLLRIAESYKQITDYQFIFTKLDETTSLGNLLNLKLYMNASIAYVTSGQNVPDDIEVFNPQKTVKQLLGGKR